MGVKHTMQKFKNTLSRGRSATTVGTALVLTGLMGTPALAAGETTYDIAPLAGGVTAQVAAAVPVILPVVGGLIALGIAIRLARKFLKA
jgi:hypothetical protein